MTNNSWQRHVKKQVVDDESRIVGNFIEKHFPERYISIREKQFRRLMFGEILVKEALLAQAEAGRLYRVIARSPDPLRLRKVTPHYVRLLFANRQVASLLMLYQRVDKTTDPASDYAAAAALREVVAQDVITYKEVAADPAFGTRALAYLGIYPTR